MRQTRVGHRYAFGCRFASDGNLARMFSEVCAIELGGDHGFLVRRLRDDDTPRVRDQRPAVGRLARERLADLRGGGDVELVLDRARAHEHVPVVLAGRRREVRRHRYELRAFERQDAVELGEANVVADREPDAPVLDLRDDGLVPRFLCLRLAVDDAPDLHVEEVDLPVRRDELAFGIEDEARVGELLASLPPLGDRAADQRDPVRPRPRRTSRRPTRRRRVAPQSRGTRQRRRSRSTSPGERRCRHPVAAACATRRSAFSRFALLSARLVI